MDQASPSRPPRLAIVWRGSDADPAMSARYAARLQPVMDALVRRGFAPEPLVYFDRDAARVRARLLDVEGALVWVNPLAEGQTRATLDAILREAADAGVLVSAHPDVIDRMGTKRVLFDTRDLGWSADVDLYASPAAMAARLPPRLASGQVRVLKPLRGNDGQGVVKVSRRTDGQISLQRAADDGAETLAPDAVLARLAPLFDQGGGVIDQAFNDNAAAGMVRCYMVQDRVAGFAFQHPRRMDAAFAMQSGKTMLPPNHPDLGDLRDLMEREWTPGLQRILAIPTHRLPLLWDADFLHRPPQEVSRARFMLCEINASCVSPFPPMAPEALADVAAAVISQRGRPATSVQEIDL